MTSSCAVLVGESVGEAIGDAIIEGVLDAALDSAFEAGKSLTSDGAPNIPVEPDDPFCSKDIFFIAPVDGLVTNNQDVYFEFGEYKSTFPVVLSSNLDPIAIIQSDSCIALFAYTLPCIPKNFNDKSFVSS